VKIALFSDIHANLRAFDACMAHARLHGAQVFAILGDMVGYGAEPSGVVTRVMQLAAQGAKVVQGNHDELAVSPPQNRTRMGDLTAGWTHAQLHRDQLAFLTQLPLIEMLGDCMLVHASAHEPAQWHYVDNLDKARLSMDAALARNPRVHCVFGGHVHGQTLYFQGAGGALMPFTPVPNIGIPVPAHRRWLATIGSVGQPRDGDPRAMYALLDQAASRLTFHRVPYDHAGAANAIRRAGLPEFFAQRLEIGR
jgi:diadenosine tetraphosphatase ApaH/serine/threonine PP2A family protein phosphatase